MPCLFKKSLIFSFIQSTSSEEIQMQYGRDGRKLFYSYSEKNINFGIQ